MQSWTESILDRMARMEESLQTIHTECRLLRGELTGTLRAKQDDDGIVEGRTTREIVEKIAWDVEKIKDKIWLDSVIEGDCSNETDAGTVQVVGDSASELISEESEDEREGEIPADFDSDYSDEEEITMNLQQLSLPRPRTKTEEELYNKIVGDCEEIIETQRITVYNAFNPVRNVPYIFVSIDNCGSPSLVNTEVAVLGGKHTFAYWNPIQIGERIQFTINPIHSQHVVLFAISTTMDNTDEKLCIVGHYTDPQAFASMAIIRSATQIPSSADELAAFVNKMTSQDDYRCDVFHYRPVPISDGPNVNVIHAHSMIAFTKARVNPRDNLYQFLSFKISIMERQERLSFVRFSLCRDLNTPFTFPNLETTRKSMLPSKYKTDSIACDSSCIVDLTNLTGTTLHNLQENFAHRKLKSCAPIFIDPLQPMSRILTLLPATTESPNYISYHLEGTDLGLMIYWNMHENSNSFALAFVPEKLVINSKLTKAMLKRDEIGHRLDRDFASVVDEPNAFTIKCSNVFAWASMTSGTKARLKIVVYSV